MSATINFCYSRFRMRLRVGILRAWNVCELLATAELLGGARGGVDGL